MKTLLVSAVALIDRDGRVLLAQRPEGKSLAGLWEFPGGKVDAGEQVEAALIRELQEELNITPTAFRPFMTVSHDYTDKQVFLDIWEVSDFVGEECGREGQQIDWVALSALSERAFPEANTPIVDRLVASV